MRRPPRRHDNRATARADAAIMAVASLSANREHWLTVQAHVSQREKEIMMDQEWEPVVGDLVYIASEQHCGRVLSVESDGGSALFIVEMDPLPSPAKAASWGHDPPEQLCCTIDELSAG